MPAKPDIPDIFVVVTENRVAYLDPYRDVAGTLLQDKPIEDDATLQEQLDALCADLFSKLSAHYTSSKVLYWRSHQPVSIDNYNQRLCDYLQRAFFSNDQPIALPGPLIFMRVLRDVAKARKLNVSDYFRLLGLQQPGNQTSANLDLGKLAGALLMIKHLTPYRFDCYTVSYALSRYLGSLGVSHTVHLGINPDPMMMHAWVSTEKGIVFDMTTTSAEFLSVLEAHV